jgi:CBS-domain-containing membrane protein
LTQSLRPLVTVAPDMSLRAASAVMRQNRIRKLVVVDGAGHLLGLFGQVNLMALLDRFCGGKAQGDERSPECGFVHVSLACRR